MEEEGAFFSFEGLVVAFLLFSRGSSDGLEFLEAAVSALGRESWLKAKVSVVATKLAQKKKS